MWQRFVEKLLVAQLVKNSPFYGIRNVNIVFRRTLTDPCPEPHKSSAPLSFLSPYNQFLILSSYLHLLVGLPSGPLHSGFLARILVFYARLNFPMCVACLAHFFLLDADIKILIVEEQKLRKSAFCNVIHIL